MLPALLMLLQAAPAAPPKAPPADGILAPVGKWVVNYEPDACIVSRGFGDKDAPIKFGFRLWPLATTMELVLVGNPAAMKLPERGQFTITTDKGPMDDPGRFESFEPIHKADAKPERVALIRADFDAFRQKAEAVTWGFAYKEKSYRFHAGAMTNVLAALADCERDLLKTWKIDPAEFDRDQLRAKPIGNPADWFNHAHEYYPAAAKAAGVEGRVVTFLTIDTTGRVTDCRPLGKPSGFDLEKVTCMLFVRYARYAPPRDDHGVPLVSHLIAPSINWQLVDY